MYPREGRNMSKTLMLTLEKTAGQYLARLTLNRAGMVEVDEKIVPTPGAALRWATLVGCREELMTADLVNNTCEVLPGWPTPDEAHNEISPTNVNLNEREIETLTWAARGKTSAEVAQILGMSKRTVDFHIDNARSKLGVATRIEAAIKAAKEALIKP